MARTGITEKILLMVTLPLIALSIVAMWQVRASQSEAALLQLKGHLLQLVQRYAAEITTQLESAVVVAESTAGLLAVNPTTDTEKLFTLLEGNLDRLSIVYGSALAYEPGYFPGHRLYSPYVFRHGDNAKERMDIATEAYDYTRPEWEWWHGPRNERRGIWTEPYLDEGAGNILMVTYAAPIQTTRRFIGVATVDIDLNAMHANLDLEGLRETDYVILTNTGHFAYHYRKDLIGKSYTRMIEMLDLKESAYVAGQMLSGKSGFFEYHHDDMTDWVFFAPVGHFGWSFAVRVNLEHALQVADLDTTPVYLWSGIIFIFGVLLTLLVTRTLLAAPLKRLGRAAEVLRQGDVPALPESLGSRQMDELRSELVTSGEQVQRGFGTKTEEIKSLNHALAERMRQLTVAKMRQSALLNAARNPTFVIDTSGEVLAANDKAETLLGCEPGTLPGSSLPGRISASQRSAFVAALEAMYASLEVQVLNTVEIDVAGGVSVTVKAILTPIYLPDGGVEGDVIFVKETQ